MVESQDTEGPETDPYPETIWRELIEIALAGLPCADLHLEDMIDRIEGRR